MIIRSLAQALNIRGITKKQIKVIPLTDETYIAFNYGCIRFTDSMRLFKNSFDKVTKSMPDDKFIELKKEFKDNYTLMKLKGVYPYEYITSFEVLNPYTFYR